MTSTTFRVLDGANPADRADWLRAWEAWPAREFNAHPAYLRLFARRGESVRAAIAYDEIGQWILYPFIMRSIPQKDSPGALFDITSAYGYGGPVAWGVERGDRLWAEFWNEFDKWATSNRVVSEFVRFQLFETPHAWYPGDVVERQPNVIVPVSEDPEVLWTQFEHKVRKNVNRAQRSGVHVTVDTSGEQLADFLSIYHSTMQRRAADEQYYFERDFFEAIHTELSGCFAYFHAHLDGQVVSTELVTISADAVYSFLGGTQADAFPARPNDLLKYEIIRWAHAAGKKYFVLGGGVTPGDGIERYKRAFAPGSIELFRTGQRVLLPKAYSELVARNTRTADLRPGFFPEYRA